jgi:hypothetical protein
VGAGAGRSSGWAPHLRTGFLRAGRKGRLAGAEEEAVGSLADAVALEAVVLPVVKSLLKWFLHRRENSKYVSQLLAMAV